MVILKWYLITSLTFSVLYLMLGYRLARLRDHDNVDGGCDG